MSRLSSIRLLRQISWSRAINALSLFASFYWSRWRGRVVHAGMPMSISIEPTTSCNLRCPECPSGLRAFTRPTGMLQAELFSNVLRQLDKHLMAVNFYFQGEPYLNKALPAMIREAVSRKLFTSTSTNAHFLDDANARATVESGLHRLIVSVDGTTQEVYEQYRVGGSLEKVLEGISRVVYWKTALKRSYPEVILQFLVVRPNEHQVEEVLEMGRKLGVDEVRYKTAQVYEFADGNPLIPNQERYSRYQRQSNGKWKLKNKLENHCWRMWQGCVITWDGKVLPCCFDKDGAHQLGDVSQTGFREIWRHPEYTQFRQAVLSSRDQIDICKNCSEGGKVWA